MSDPTPAQRRFDALVRRRGSPGVLRQRGLADRPISVSVQQESPMERLGGTSNPLDRVALVSGLARDTGLVLDPVPSERDVLVVGGVLLKIVAPPDSMGADLATLYWRVKVRA